MSKPTITTVRPMDHKATAGHDAHLITFTDEQNRPGMIGVLGPGIHCIGTAPWNMEVHVLQGLLHEYQGERMLDEHSRSGLEFKKGQVVHLRVADPAEGNPNSRYPVTFRAYPTCE